MICDIRIVGDPGINGALGVDVGATQTTFQNVNVEVADAGAGGGQGIALSDQAATDVLISDSFITAGRYGVLTNISSGSSVIDGVLNVGNYITAGIGDAIEYNHPSQAGRNFLTSGVILNVATGSAPSAGFAYGVANVEYSVLSGAIIRQAYEDAIHLEDRFLGAVVSAVSGHDIVGHGVTILNNSIGQDPDGAVLVGLHMTHDSTSSAGHYGLNVVYDTPGSVRGNIAVGTYFKGFETAYYLGGATGNSPTPHVLQLIQGVARDATNAALGAPAFMVGNIVALNCGTLARGSGSTRFDSIHSDEQPATAILSRSDSGGPGVYMRGFSYPIVGVSHAGGGAENKTLFALPTRLSGRLICRWEAGTHGVFWSGEINWDGSSLTTVTNSIIEHEPGNTTVASPTESGGNLVLPLTNNSGAVAASPLLVEFSGVFYVA